jgi:hypothetical protein
MILLGPTEKKSLYEIMLSKIIQGKQENRDLLNVFNHLDPETLDFDDFVAIDNVLGFEIEILLQEDLEDEKVLLSE